MPGPYLYPGIYVEEIPSGVRPIAGASTSDTAFVDYFPRGTIDRAVRITSLSDFEREFGGLDPNSEASYAIQQYYLNGGRIAWVVRVVAPDAEAASRVLSGSQVYPGMSGASGAGSGAGPSGAILTVDARSPGKWGNNLQVAIDYRGVPLLAGSPSGFNLVVREVAEIGGKRVVKASETYRNLNVDETSSRYVETVINRDSQMIRVTYTGAGALPGPTGGDVVGDPLHALWLILGQDGYQEGAQVQAARAEWGTVTFTAGNDGATPDTDDWQQSVGAAALLGSAGPSDPFNRGIYELERIAPNIFNLLCLPAAATLRAISMKTLLHAAATFC